MPTLFCQMFRSPILCKTVLLFVLIIVAGTAFAAGAANAQQAAKIALEQNGGSGKVLGVSTEKDSKGGQVFAVKMLSNGRVRVVRIPRD